MRETKVCLSQELDQASYDLLFFSFKSNIRYDFKLFLVQDNMQLFIQWLA